MRGRRLDEVHPERRFVTVYRAVPAGASGFKTNDYVTLRHDWAKKHAQHVADSDETHAHVLRAIVPSHHVHEAPNPDEYFYTGPGSESRVSHRTRPSYET